MNIYPTAKVQKNFDICKFFTHEIAELCYLLKKTLKICKFRIFFVPLSVFVRVCGAHIHVKREIFVRTDEDCTNRIRQDGTDD